MKVYRATYKAIKSNRVPKVFLKCEDSRNRVLFYFPKQTNK